jgi:hypothetical protein
LEQLQADDQLENVDRQALLVALFALWKHGCEYGIEVDEIPEVLAQQGTTDERTLIDQWVQQEKAVGKDAGNSRFADFLTILREQ